MAVRRLDDGLEVQIVPMRRRLLQLDGDELQSRAVTSLARQFGMSRARLRRLVVGFWTHDWDHDPFARGAYSYSAVGGSDASSWLARPLSGTASGASG